MLVLGVCRQAVTQRSYGYGGFTDHHERSCSTRSQVKTGSYHNFIAVRLPRRGLKRRHGTGLTVDNPHKCDVSAPPTANYIGVIRIQGE